MRPPTLYTLGALLGGAAACHGPIAEVQWSYVDAPRPIDNLIVYEAIQHDARVGVLFRGFETRLQQRLEACRVHTTLRHGLPDAETTPDNPTAGTPTEAPEQAHLTVVPWGGTYTMVTGRRDVDVTTKIDGSFKLELFDSRANKVVWRAVIDIKTNETPEMSDGREFADTVLARMQSDHVIRCE